MAAWKAWPRDTWLQYADDLPEEIVIAELSETSAALESQSSLKREALFFRKMNDTSSLKRSLGAAQRWFGECLIVTCNAMQQ